MLKAQEKHSMHIKHRVVVAIAGAVITASAQADRPSTSLTLGVTPSYYEGDYGTTTTTKIFYLPVWAKLQAGDLSLKLTVPYLSVQSAGALVSGGTVIGNGGNKTVTSNSGLGDVWAEGRYRFRGAGGMPDISPYMKIKFGTASYSNGLGTGQNDFEPGVGFEWAVGNVMFPFADVGYRVVGSPPGLALRDVATYDGGMTYKLDDRNFLTGMFAGHEATQPGFAGTADLLVAWNYYTRPGSGFQVYVDKGLSNGSPNYGVGGGVQTRF